MQTNKQSAGVIAELWRRMVAIYGHKWLSGYGPTDADDTWAYGLRGMTPEKIGRGIDACIESGEEWPPSLPMFRNRCLGIPPLSLVIQHLMRGSTRDGFEGAVFERLDQWALQRADNRTAEKMISRAYLAVRSEAIKERPMLEKQP